MGVPGHATAIQDRTNLIDGAAVVSTPQGALRVVDCRPPTVFSAAEHDAALADLARRAGPATEGVVVRVNESFSAVRAELNELAGGQASSRVMLLSHTAQRAQLAVELHAQVSAVEHGRFASGEDKTKQLEALSKGLRNMVGMCAFAADLLNKAHAAATEEGKAKRPNAHEQLLTTLGVAVQTSSPDRTPGVGSFGSPSASIPAPSEETE